VSDGVTWRRVWGRSTSIGRTTTVRHCQVGFFPSGQRVEAKPHPWSERLIERRSGWRQGCLSRTMSAPWNGFWAISHATDLGRLIQNMGVVYRQRGWRKPWRRWPCAAGERRGPANDARHAPGHRRRWCPGPHSGEGWKEVKVAVVFAYAPVCRSSLAAEPDELETTETNGHLGQSYCGLLGRCRSFEPSNGPRPVADIYPKPGNKSAIQ